MNGRIEVLSTESSPGLIKSENGVSARFSASEVSVHDAKGLAIGQLVTFDLESGSPPKAVNISIERQHYISHGVEKRPQAFRYIGFEQKGNIRLYKFERLSRDGRTQGAIVASDLALFMKHGVGIQEGPALCLRLVMAEDRVSADGSPRPQRSLTEKDMLAHLASRSVPEKRRHSGRTSAANSRVANPSWRGTKTTAS